MTELDTFANRLEERSERLTELGLELDAALRDALDARAHVTALAMRHRHECDTLAKDLRFYDALCGHEPDAD